MKKMIFTVLILLSVLIPYSANSDTAYTFICNIAGTEQTQPIRIESSTDLATKRVSEILDHVGLEKNFAVYAANVDNASALIKGQNRLILYNPHFMQRVRNTAGFDWTSYSILAHEIGHHLNGHTIQHGGSRPSIELEADEFSGFVLRKMGASLKEAQTAMALISGNHATKTHPAKKDRLTAIERGWRKGGY